MHSNCWHTCTFVQCTFTHTYICMEHRNELKANKIQLEFIFCNKRQFNQWKSTSTTCIRNFHFLHIFCVTHKYTHSYILYICAVLVSKRKVNIKKLLCFLHSWLKFSLKLTARGVGVLNALIQRVYAMVYGIHAPCECVSSKVH